MLDRLSGVLSLGFRGHSATEHGRASTSIITTKPNGCFLPTLALQYAKLSIFAWRAASSNVDKNSSEERLRLAPPAAHRPPEGVGRRGPRLLVNMTAILGQCALVVARMQLSNLDRHKVCSHQANIKHAYSPYY